MGRVILPPLVGSLVLSASLLLSCALLLQCLLVSYANMSGKCCGGKNNHNMEIKGFDEIYSN